MPKKVVLIGHCGPDSSYLRITVGKAGRDIQVLSADDDGELAGVMTERALARRNVVLDRMEATGLATPEEVAAARATTRRAISGAPAQCRCRYDACRFAVAKPSGSAPRHAHRTDPLCVTR